MSDNSVRIGVVGVGYWGPNIIRNLNGMEGVQLVGVCDLSKDALNRVKLQYPDISLFNSFDNMIDLAKPDGVVIVTPASTHSTLARQALECGIDVLVEKPLATTYDDALMLTRISKENKRVLMVGHTFLYSEYVRTLKKIIANGEIGKILHIYSERLALGQIRSDVDVLWNLGPHDISIVNYLIGSTPMEVAAWGLNILDPVKADLVVGKLVYSHGITVYLHLSWLDPQKVRKMIIVGSEKMIIYDDTNSEAPVIIHDKNAIIGPEGKILMQNGDKKIVSVSLPEPLGVELRHFIRCVQKRENPITDGIHGSEVIAVLESLSLSMKNGGTPVSVQLREL